MAIQQLDATVGWKHRPTIEVEGIGEVQVAPVMASPSDKPKSYWARSPRHGAVVFAATPSKAVWMLIGKVEGARRIAASLVIDPDECFFKGEGPTMCRRCQDCFDHFS